MAKKKNKKGDFGWNKGKTWNDPSKSHGDKGESTKYSFKLKGKAKPRKAWCSPGSAEVIKKSQSVGRPYGYKPIYDQTDIYNYQSEEARYRRALERSPDLILSKLYLYRASNGCYNHIVIPPDFTYEDFLDVIKKIPWEFAVTAPPEFWLNFPAPSEPRPGQPLIPPDLSWNTPGSGFPDYPIPKFGCTNPEAENYDPEAEIDDGSCILPFSGCTDPEADNYDPDAVYDNGSCAYPEDDEPPEGPCDPPTCTLAPKYNSKWVVVDEATALSGGGCPVGYDNHGYAELADGTFQVLCQYTESTGSTFQRLWYRYPGENWVKVDSSAGGLYSWFEGEETGTFTVIDSSGNLFQKKGVYPTVYLSCERPGDTPQSLDPKKIQDKACPGQTCGPNRILDNGSLRISFDGDYAAISRVLFGGRDWYNPGTPVSNYVIAINQNFYDFDTYSNGNTGTYNPLARVCGSPSKISADSFIFWENVSIERVYSLAKGANAFIVKTTFKNNSESPVLVEFAETFDPDQDFDFNSNFNTRNSIITLGGILAARAIGEDTSYTVIMGSPNSESVVEAAGDGRGFFEIDNYSRLVQFLNNPQNGQGIVDDLGIHCGFRRTLAANETYTFSMVQGFGTTISEAENSFLAAISQIP